jgi:hypothetical protein
MIPFRHCPYGQFGQQPAGQLPWLIPFIISGQLRLPEAEEIIEEVSA